MLAKRCPLLGALLAVTALGACGGGSDGGRPAEADRPSPSGEAAAGSGRRGGSDRVLGDAGDDRGRRPANRSRVDGFPSDLVVRVIDGDTVELARLGRVRLIGVDTPERGTCYEDAATAFTRRELEGERVGYELGADRTDRYDRTLAYLYRDGMHNAALLRRGYAKVLTIAPNDRYVARFERIERDARGADLGLWTACDVPAAPSPRRPSRRDRPTLPSRPAAPDAGGVIPENCTGIAGPIPTPPGDPTGLDGDNDGLACE
ncbi:MAG: thermonuclease family protein [Thermoleophilaceae bacterium]